MRSFKEYAKQAPQPQSASINGQGGGQVCDESAKTQETTASAAELASQIARVCNGKSNAAMLQSILAEAEKSKRAGTLSNAEIDAFYQSFAPMLDGVQKRKLCAVVERLKEIE